MKLFLTDLGPSKLFEVHRIPLSNLKHLPVEIERTTFVGDPARNTVSSEWSWLSSI